MSIFFKLYHDENKLHSMGPCPLCTKTTLKPQSVGRNVTTLGHIILILNQPVIALSP